MEKTKKEVKQEVKQEAKQEVKEVSNIWTKVFNVQQEVGAVTKSLNNPFYKSKYADINKFIDVLLPALKESGLVVIQPLTSVDGLPALQTIIIDKDTKESFSLAPIIMPQYNKPQEVGSCITYYRRYALQSFFLLKADDDDGDSTRKAKEIVKEPAKAEQSNAYYQAENAIAQAKTSKELVEYEERVINHPKLTDLEKEILNNLIQRKGKEIK